MNDIKRWARNFAVPNLTSYLCFAMVLIYIADLLLPAMRPDLEYSLNALFFFDRGSILSGQVWRVLTFTALPINYSPLWFVISVIVYFTIGRELEGAWGAHKLTLFLLLEWVLTVAVGFIFGYTGNYNMYLGMFLVYGMILPHMQFRLFFLIPVEARYLAIADMILMILSIFLDHDMSALAAFTAFLIFFGKDLITPIKNRRRHKQFMNAFKHRNDDK